VLNANLTSAVDDPRLVKGLVLSSFFFSKVIFSFISSPFGANLLKNILL